MKQGDQNINGANKMDEENKQHKTFDDLEFGEWEGVRGEIARMDFPNGFLLEVGIYWDSKSYDVYVHRPDPPEGDDIDVDKITNVNYHRRTSGEVTDIMRLLQPDAEKEVEAVMIKLKKFDG